MGTVHVEVTEQAKSKLEDLASETGYTLSDVILKCVCAQSEMGWDSGTALNDLSSEVTPSTLNNVTRLILLNQEVALSMNAGLDDQERMGHERNVKILEEGYALEYEDIFARLKPEISCELCGEVCEILDMFRALRHAYEVLKDEEKTQIDEKDISFRGFDRNNRAESRLIEYVAFLFKCGEYQELEEPMKRFSDNGNSHKSLLPRYRSMYSIFGVIRSKQSGVLTLSQIKQIIC